MVWVKGVCGLWNVQAGSRHVSPSVVFHDVLQPSSPHVSYDCSLGWFTGVVLTAALSGCSRGQGTRWPPRGPSPGSYQSKRARPCVGSRTTPSGATVLCCGRRLPRIALGLKASSALCLGALLQKRGQNYDGVRVAHGRGIPHFACRRSFSRRAVRCAAAAHESVTQAQNVRCNEQGPDKPLFSAAVRCVRPLSSGPLGLSPQAWRTAITDVTAPVPLTGGNAGGWTQTQPSTTAKPSKAPPPAITPSPTSRGAASQPRRTC